MWFKFRELVGWCIVCMSCGFLGFAMFEAGLGGFYWWAWFGLGLLYWKGKVCFALC